jgi:hypothetical protein
MARIPLPERGQPLDVAYIYTLANALNDLSTQVSPSTYKYVTVDTPGSSTSRQNVKASEARIIGGYVEVANNSTVSAGNEKSFSYDFPAEFKFAPIATATIVNTGNTAAGKDVSVILKSVTTSKIEGTVTFGTSGDVSVAINLIVVGIPV